VSERTRSILEAAGVEHAARRPVASGEVIPLPLVSRHLTARHAPPEAIPEPPVAEPAAQPAIPEGAYIWPEWMQWPLRLGKYLGFLCVLVAVLVAVLSVRQTLILADVGRSTCSTLKIADDPEAQVFWTQEDAASTVPALRTHQFVACMRAGSPF
jgi:hypothetical protein